MSDPVTFARSARESLAKGLNALQADPNLPAHLIQLAEPIAQAMGALHQIERSNGAEVLPHAANALKNVQGALAQLQAVQTPPPPVLNAMEAVAASLGMVHALTKRASSAPPANSTGPMPATGSAPNQPAAPAFMQQPPAPAPAYVAPPAQAAPVAPPAPMQAAAPMQAPPMQAAPVAQPTPMHAPMQAAPPQGFPPSGARPAAPQAPAAASADPFAQRPSAPQPAAAAPAAPRQSVPSPPPDGQASVIDAALGAHSPTNFYKGLSGNDIIEHGGLFVATYMVPKIGTKVRLRVALPGGYEFEANALVKWSREAVDPFGDSQPGFGAQFLQISPEAKQLVQRYVRNREPLFHDDL